ncbi:MAG: ribbon-helix-helix domain-containing protein [Desulfomonilia bacterium]
MRLDSDLMKKVKILAIEEGKKANSIIEEALNDLLKKYDVSTSHDEGTS